MISFICAGQPEIKTKVIETKIIRDYVFNCGFIITIGVRGKREGTGKKHCQSMLEERGRL